MRKWRIVKEEPLGENPYYDDLVSKYAQRYGVDPQLAIRVHRAEYDPNKWVSHAGARGPMQLMPDTADMLGVNPDIIEENIEGGVRYLKMMLDQFKEPALALAAYNAGPGAVQKHGGIPPYPETQRYVKKILGDSRNEGVREVMRRFVGGQKKQPQKQWKVVKEEPITSKQWRVVKEEPVEIPSYDIPEATVEVIKPSEVGQALKDTNKALGKPAEGFIRGLQLMYPALTWPSLWETLGGGAKAIEDFSAWLGGDQKADPIISQVFDKLAEGARPEWSKPRNTVEQIAAIPSSIVEGLAPYLVVGQIAAPLKAATPAGHAAKVAGEMGVVDALRGYHEGGIEGAVRSGAVGALTGPGIVGAGMAPALKGKLLRIPGRGIAALLGGALGGASGLAHGSTDPIDLLTSAGIMGGLSALGWRGPLPKAPERPVDLQQERIARLQKEYPGMDKTTAKEIAQSDVDYANVMKVSPSARAIRPAPVTAFDVSTPEGRYHRLKEIFPTMPEDVARNISRNETLYINALKRSGERAVSGSAETFMPDPNLPPRQVKINKTVTLEDFYGLIKSRDEARIEAELRGVVQDRGARVAIDWLNPGKIYARLRYQEGVPVENAKDMARVYEKIYKKTLPSTIPQEQKAPPVRSEGDLMGGTQALLAQPAQVEPLAPPNIMAQIRLGGAEGTGKELVRLQDIRAKIDALIAPIRDGRFRLGRGSRKVLGIAKTRELVTRLAKGHAEDIPVIAHETGHHLHKLLYPETGFRKTKSGDSTLIVPQEWKPYLHELDPMAYPGAREPKAIEGFAEFIRYYITEPDRAAIEAPNFYRYFEDILKAKDPYIYNQLLDVSKAYETWMKMDDATYLESRIRRGADGAPSQKPLLDTLDKIKYYFVDEYWPLEKVERLMAEGRELPPSLSPVAQARLLSGWQGKPQAWLEYKRFNFKGKEIGKSLKEILAPVKDRIKEFEHYIACKRARELESRGKASGFRDDVIERTIAKYEQEFFPVFKELLAFQDDMVQYLVDAQLISRVVAHSMRRLNKFYVPFYRVMENDALTSLTGVQPKGVETHNRLIKRIKGNDREIHSPLESILRNLYTFMYAAERNRVGLALYKLHKRAESKGRLMEGPLPPKLMPIKGTIDEVVRGIPELKDLVDLYEMGDMDFTIFRPSMWQRDANHIAIYLNGKEKIFRVPEDLARSYRALDGQNMNLVTKILNYPARWLRSGAVVYNPEFAIRNPFRDMFAAFVYTKYGFRPGYDFIRGMFHAIKKDDVYWDWVRSGAPTAMITRMDREFVGKRLEEILEQKGAKHLVKHILTFPKDIPKVLRLLTEYGECATRLAEFERGLKAGGRSFEGIQKAGLAARDITLDFNRFGAYGRAINAVIPFWNVNIQGLDKMMRELTRNPKKAAVMWGKIGGSIVLPSILLTLVNHQDPRYQNAPEWEKALFWHIMPLDPNAEPWRIPKPPGLGMFFATVPQMALEWYLDQTPGASGRALRTIAKSIETFNPGFMPLGFLLPHELGSNWSHFLQQPIEGPGLQGLPYSMRYGPYDRELTKTVGKLLGQLPLIGETPWASPKRIEYAIRSLFGGGGRLLLEMADVGLRKMGLLDDVSKPTPLLSDIPILRAFKSRYPVKGEVVKEFYRNYESASQWQQGAKRLIEEQKPGEALRAMAQHPQAFVKLNSHYRGLLNLDKIARFLYFSPQFTPELKREWINWIFLTQTHIAQQGNKMFYELKNRVSQNLKN